MENGPLIDGFPIKTSIYEGFSMAMLNNQLVEKTGPFRAKFIACIQATTRVSSIAKAAVQVVRGVD